MHLALALGVPAVKACLLTGLDPVPCHTHTTPLLSRVAPLPEGRLLHHEDA